METVTIAKPKGLSQWMCIYRLYLRAFPASERKPFSVIVRMYRGGSADVWCIRKGSRLQGFAATVNGKNRVLLDYLAVEETCRGQGIGTAAMETLKRHYGERSLFVEIESTLEESPGCLDRQKRKDFYLGCGMTDMQVEAEVFGVRMELLGWGEGLTFDSYREFYRRHYSSWAAEHIKPIE